MSIDAIAERRREELRQTELDSKRSRQEKVKRDAYKEACDCACWFHHPDAETPHCGTYLDWARWMQEVWSAAEAIGKLDALSQQLDRQVENANDAYLYAAALLRLARDSEAPEELAAKLEQAEELHLLEDVRYMLEVITVHRIFQPETRQAREEQDTPEVEPTAPQRSVDDRTTSGKSTEDWQELVLAGVGPHHRYDGQSIDNTVAPIKQRDLMRELDIEKKHKARVSEAFKALFGSHQAYLQLCRKPDSLLRKLQVLNGEKPSATGAADRIDGISGSDESLIDAVLDR